MKALVESVIVTVVDWGPRSMGRPSASVPLVSHTLSCSVRFPVKGFSREFVKVVLRSTACQPASVACCGAMSNRPRLQGAGPTEALLVPV